MHVSVRVNLFLLFYYSFCKKKRTLLKHNSAAKGMGSGGVVNGGLLKQRNCFNVLHLLRLCARTQLIIASVSLQWFT